MPSDLLDFVRESEQWTKDKTGFKKKKQEEDDIELLIKQSEEEIRDEVNRQRVSAQRAAAGFGPVRQYRTTEAWAAKTPEEIQQAKSFLRKRAKQQLEKSPLPNVFATTQALGATIISGAARLTGQARTADYMQRFADGIRQAAAERDVEKGGVIPPIVKRGLRGAGETVPAMLLAGPAGPYAVIGQAAAIEANQAITEGKDAGLKGKELVEYAARQGIIEGSVAAAFQAVGLGGAEKIIGGKVAVASGVSKALKQFGVNTLQELPEEIITELGHNVARSVSGVDPDATSTKQLAQTAADTTVQTLITMGLIETPGVVGAARPPQPIKKEQGILEAAASEKAPSRSQWRAWGLPREEGRSARGRKEGIQREAERIRKEAVQATEETAVVQEAPVVQETTTQEGEAPTVKGTPEVVPFMRGQTGELVTGPEMPAIERLKQEVEEAQPKRKGFLKEESGAKWLGGSERIDIIGRQQQVDMSVGIPEVDRRLEAARGIKRPGLYEKLKEGLKTTWHYATRPQANIPKRNPFFATANETFRLLKTVPRTSRDEGIRITRAIIDPLGPRQLELFGRYAQIRNQLAALEAGQPLRHGFSSKQQVEAYKNKLEALVEQTPEVKEAFTNRTEVVRDIVNAAVAHNLLPESAMQNTETFFHQQVLMYHLAKKRMNKGVTLERTKKGFQRKRKTGEGEMDEIYDYNTDYMESEISWMSDALSQIRKEQILDKLISQYGRTDEFQQKAKESNISLAKAVRDSEEKLGLWQPMPGNIFYKAWSVPDRVAEKLMEGEIENFDLSADELKEVITIGNNRESVVLPQEIVDELDSARKPDDPHFFDKANQEFIKMWKMWSTIGPKRFIPYSTRNITGDISPVIAVDPGILLEVPSAARDLWNMHKATKPLTEEQLASRNTGVVASGFFESEVENVINLPAFKHLDVTGKRVTSTITRPIKSYMSVAGPINNFREDLLRHAAFRFYRKRFKAGKEINYGASQKPVIDNLKKEMGVDVASAHLARNLVGDYGNMSVAGDWLRRHMIPFWSFQEINLKRWPQITANALQSGKGRGRLGAVYAAIATLRLAQGYAALQVWNNLIAPLIFGCDDDDDLPPYDRANPHIMLGRTKDGSIRIFRNVGALGDFFEWLGINEAFSMMKKWKNSQVETTDIIKEMAKSPLEKIVGGLRPDIKGGYEVLTGQSLFPSPFEPRSVESGEAAANIFGLPDEYKWVKGMVIGEGNRARENYWQRVFFGVVDPQAAALSEIYDLRRSFLDSKGKPEKGVYPISEYRNARNAAINEDYNAFVEWKAAFEKKYPGRAGGKFMSFVKRMDPISSRLNDADEREFVLEYLNNEQREKLRASRDYVRELQSTLIMWWKAASKTGNKPVE